KPMQNASGGTTGTEVGCLLEDECNSTEHAVELGSTHLAAPRSRIIKMEPSGFYPFEHDEMIHVHEQNRRQPDRAEVFGFELHALGLHAQTACCLENIHSFAAVARHAAKDPQFLEGHPAAVVREYHGQRRRPAFKRFNLQNGGGLDPCATGWRGL